jgi:hypothetical protein
MTLSSNNPPGRTMNFSNDDSSAGVRGSIPVNVQTRATRTRRTARRIKATLALAALSLALVALPGQAFATETCTHAQTDSVDNQYCTPVESLPVQSPPVQSLQAGLGSGGGGGPAQKVAVPAASSGPSLPFTGLDVAALAVVALALTGTGVVLRRLATIGDSEK